LFPIQIFIQIILIFFKFLKLFTYFNLKILWHILSWDFATKFQEVLYMVKLEEKSVLKKKAELLTPKIDVVFHALFRQSNKQLAEKFISAILGEKVKIKRVDLDRHLEIKNANEKLGVMDYRAELVDDSNCIIEIQLLEKKAEIERFLYYWANTYARQLQRSEEYDKLCKTISIIIVDHEIAALKNIQAASTRWKIQNLEFNHVVLTDHLEMCIIELPKAKRLLKEMMENEICQWMWFLDEPNSEEVSQIMQKNEDIRYAVEELESVSEDAQTRIRAELRLKAIRDEKAERAFAIEKGLEEGRQKGLKEGIKEGIRETVIKMLKLNMDVLTIKQISGFSEQEIMEIKEQK